METPSCPETVIAGLTRKSRFDDAKRVNLPSDGDTSSRSGDGVPLSRNDGSSAMTA